MIRALTEADVTFTITVEQDDEPLRGNVMDSGDPEVDRAYEDEVALRLARGEVWAWCEVTVTATWVFETKEGQFISSGNDTLCCCSYEDEADFIACNDYYPQMKASALAELNKLVRMQALAVESLATTTPPVTKMPISEEGEEQTYTVYAECVITPSAEYTAKSAKEALEMALDDDAHRVTLCRECGSFDPSDPDNWRVEDEHGNVVLDEDACRELT